MIRKKEVASNPQPKVPYLDQILSMVRGTIYSFDSEIGNGRNVRGLKTGVPDFPGIRTLYPSYDFLKELQSASGKSPEVFEEESPKFLRTVSAYRNALPGERTPGDYSSNGEGVLLFEAGVFDRTVFNNIFYGTQLNGCNQFEVRFSVPPKSRNNSFWLKTGDLEVTLGGVEEIFKKYSASKMEVFNKNPVIYGRWFRIHTNS